MTAPLLEVERLELALRAGRGWLKVVEDVSFAIAPGEAVGLVGESGAGKTLTGLALLGLLPRELFRAGGRVRLDGEDILNLPESALRRLRGRRISMIFQEPMTALDPVFTVGEQIAETLRAHTDLSPAAAKARAVEALAEVGIPLPARRAEDYPHQLSGGMRQRVMIAIALACEPRLLVADEPTTALDVTIQAQIIDLLLRQVSARGTALLLVSHNIGVVRECCSRIVAMYAGQVVEDAAVDALLERPLHPYASGLLRSHPRFAPHRARLPSIGGRAPAPGAMPPGCRFAPRCAHRTTGCDAAQPLLPLEGRAVRCHRAAALDLPGAVP
ncbi:ABC transporter ATP-binding protein [Roseomonas sp. AR75]|uniref:ABC transporter ATP-binding protein n=1 Tax=Roseomonas sp. AR75 TaxID=2562311 RepID=UPI001F0F5D72|nr:ABC transporter ATP-binding protein [Roseomonas sp. AR75]